MLIENFRGKEAAAVTAVKYAFSKNPLINRIDKLSSNVPIWFIFGARSWIKSQDGFRVAEIRPETAKTFVKVIDILIIISKLINLFYSSRKDYQEVRS